jgi:hypothetical protein
MRRRLIVSAVSVAAALAVTGAASAYTSFSLYVSSAYIWSYSNTLEVRASASYQDYDCSPSYQCDRNVMVEFVVHRGYGTYSPVVGRAYDQTGQYGSSATARFRMPNCRYLKKYSSQPYTVEVNAAAPDGSEKQTTRTVYLRSCAR